MEFHASLGAPKNQLRNSTGRMELEFPRPFLRQSSLLRRYFPPLSHSLAIGGQMLPRSADLVLDLMRQPCLEGVHLVPDRQPTRAHAHCFGLQRWRPVAPAERAARLDRRSAVLLSPFRPRTSHIVKLRSITVIHYDAYDFSAKGENRRPHSPDILHRGQSLKRTLVI